ncbi:MAG: gas vesicle protein GvpG [Actinomycetota bacterium]|nr:gas vesicle protein GvpG [Actinomycetota bacterium]
MSKQRATFSKRQRDQDKQAKAAAKRERRATRLDGDDESPPDTAGNYDQEGVLAALARLHQSYDDGEVGLEDFEVRRDELRSRLRVD